MRPFPPPVKKTRDAAGPPCVAAPPLAGCSVRPHTVANSPKLSTSHSSEDAHTHTHTQHRHDTHPTSHTHRTDSLTCRRCVAYARVRTLSRNIDRDGGVVMTAVFPGCSTLWARCGRVRVRVRVRSPGGMWTDTSLPLGLIRSYLLLRPRQRACSP